jgi:hypothetical protein
VSFRKPSLVTSDRDAVIRYLHAHTIWPSSYIEHIVRVAKRAGRWRDSEGYYVITRSRAEGEWKVYGF